MIHYNDVLTVGIFRALNEKRSCDNCYFLKNFGFPSQFCLISSHFGALPKTVCKRVGNGSKKADVNRVTSFYVMELTGNIFYCDFSVKASSFLRIVGLGTRKAPPLSSVRKKRRSK